MCSVLDCESFRRGVQRFKLPHDPEKRLEWVQFIFEVNGQRLKETSWTDITVCREHFTDDCFDNPNPTSGLVQLKPGVVPSLCVKSEPDEPVVIPQHVVHVETTDGAIQCDDPKISADPNLCCKNSGHTYTVWKTDPNRKIATSQEVKEKYVVNENCLLELFGRKCPLCKCKLQMEKITYEELIILSQRCLKCCYTNQWKSQVNADVPSDAGGHLTRGTQADEDKPSVVVSSEIITFTDEDSDSADEEEGDVDDASSDGGWNPAGECLLAKELPEDSENETEEEEDDETELDSHVSLKINELCTECGSFFNALKPHMCEHKIKPYSCNICGKRCVTEISLKNHSRFHEETYEHPCKYCYVTFKTRADKLKHEQTHQEREDRYKCPDCPETFATNRQRRTHLTEHRAPKEFRCGVCGIDFKDVHHLRRHSVVHTGLKPYKCSVCQRGFNQTSHLKSHMRLHTGEKPYKCQHCDKRFNHNVSLKSHIQRCHSSTSGQEWKRGEGDKRLNEAEDNGKKRNTDSDFDNANAQQDEEDALQKKRAEKPKSKRRSTGRPRGRPKRYTAGSKPVKGATEGKTAKSKVWKLKRTGSSEEESKGEQSGTDLSSDSAGEDEEEEERVKNSTGSFRRRAKNITDSGFNLEEEEKTKNSCQNSDKRLGKGTDRARKEDRDIHPGQSLSKC